MRSPGSPAHWQPPRTPGARFPMEITPGRRYTTIADEFTWAAGRGLVAGMHVHVSVPDADRAIALHDALRSFLPLLTALGANGPYLEGLDSGLATVRPKLCEGLPRQGIPPAFGSFDRMVEFVTWGSASGAFPDASHLWWEVRLHAPAWHPRAARPRHADEHRGRGGDRVRRARADRTPRRTLRRR